MPRPIGVTMVAGMSALCGLVLFVFGAEMAMSSDPVFQALSASALVIGLIYVLSGLGLLQGLRWAWPVAMIASVLLLIRNLVQVAIGSVVPAAVPGIAVSLLIIYCLNISGVKAYFRRGMT